MRKYKIKLMILVFLIISIPGILKINYEYTKKNKRYPGSAVIISSDNINNPIRTDLYNEIRLSRKSQKKLKLHFSSRPFDLRLVLGDNIFYINKQAVENISDYFGGGIRQGITYFNQGVYNVVSLGRQFINSIKEKVNLAESSM